MLHCTTDKYNLLYAKYLNNPGALLDWVGYDPNLHSLLDLCGGTGAVAEEARRRGGGFKFNNDIILYDLNPRCDTVTCVKGNANSCFDLRRLNRTFDLIVCRQAINYLNLPKLNASLSFLLNPGGHFVFNTFTKPKYDIKFYKYENRRYLELSCHIGKRILHLQTTLGSFDISSFKWYSKSELISAFFNLSLIDEKITDKSIWLNFKKPIKDSSVS